MSTQRDIKVLLVSRGLRAFADGCVSLLLPYYLAVLGYNAFQIGVLVTATLLGSGLLTLGVGLIAYRYHERTLLKVAACLMAATGLALAATSDFWPLVVVAIVGTVNPSAGDVSVFRPLEQALLARSVDPANRTSLFARYSLVGYLFGALGAQAAGLPAVGQQWMGIDAIVAVKAMFIGYAVLGMVCLGLFRALSRPIAPVSQETPAPISRSKRFIYTMAALISLDSFGTGFAVQSLLALWLLERYELSIVATGAIFFWTGIVSALSQLFSAPLAKRIGLVNTMVFTHLPSSVFLMLVPLMPTLPLALLCLMLCRALSQMDVPARDSYIMAVVEPTERPAAASITRVPSSFTSAISPMIAGFLLSLSPFGWPLIISGALKVVYDLTLLGTFRRVRPPEELR